jgi:hypothetical protein
MFFFFISLEKGCYSAAISVFLHLVDAEGIPPSKILLLGKSFGCAVAVHVASSLKGPEEKTKS